MYYLTERESKFIAEGIVRKRYGLLQLGVMVCITIFIIVAWQFATANFVWFILGMIGLWLLVFEPLRYVEMKREMRKLQEFNYVDSGLLKESAWSDNGIQEEILELYIREYELIGGTSYGDESQITATAT